VKAELSAPRNVRIAPADIVFRDGLDLVLGSVRVQVRHVGGDHADDSTVMYEPDGLLFLGDCLYEAPSGGYTADQVGPLVSTAGPSFELFYENDYLMPHREAAWALLEERVREAANFCDLIGQSTDERVSSQLEQVRTALLGVADSLASHFGDWGTVSRFAAREPTEEGTLPADAATDRRDHMGDRVTYEQDIRPLFRDRDIQSMSFAFDLSSYDDVRANAEAIYERLAAGSMPCDGRWPAEDVQRFRSWIDTGSPP
jgi:hypothetical protein